MYVKGGWYVCMYSGRVCVVEEGGCGGGGCVHVCIVEGCV